MVIILQHPNSMQMNPPHKEETGEIVVYQPGTSPQQIDVKILKDTVRLSLTEMVQLFERDKSVLSRHIKNVFLEKELERCSTVANFATVQNENGRSVERKIDYYNLDVIISVGYRIKSKRGTDFRIRATRILKEYLYKGYIIHQRFENLEQRVACTEEKINFFVKTALPPVEWIFYDGQIFDAYAFVTDLIKSAKKRVVLIDNYVDETTLPMLSKRAPHLPATIYTDHISPQLQLDLQKHNAQYSPIEVNISKKNHDRFLIVDDEMYHIGASIKDLGTRLFAFSKMESGPEGVLESVEG